MEKLAAAATSRPDSYRSKRTVVVARIVDEDEEGEGEAVQEEVVRKGQIL